MFTHIIIIFHRRLWEDPAEKNQVDNGERSRSPGIKYPNRDAEMMLSSLIVSHFQGVESTESLDSLPTPVPVASNPRIRPSRSSFDEDLLILMYLMPHFPVAFKDVRIVVLPLFDQMYSFTAF